MAASSAHRRSLVLRIRRAGPGTVVGAAIVAVFAAGALSAPAIAPHDPTYQYVDGLTSIGEPLPPGSPTFWLGTDALGRDLFSRLVYGARVAIFIAVVPNALALALALAVGTVAGVYGGLVETVAMRVTETLMVLPTFLLAL